MSFIKEAPQIEILDDKVRVTLVSPYSYAESEATKFVDIPYMTSSDYRLLKGDENTKAGEVEMLMKLTGMSERELDLLSPADFAGCLGVVAGFFLEFKTVYQSYYARSTELFLQRVQASLAK